MGPIEWGLITLLVSSAVALTLKVRRDAARLDDVADMRSVPSVPLRSVVRDDVVRVTGRVAAGPQQLTAPISGRPCVAYRVELRRLGRSGSTFSNDESCGFFLEDGDARAFVQPPIPVLALEARLRGGGGADDLPAPFRAWLAERHASDEWRADRLRWIERRIEPGERVAIVGVARETEPTEAVSGYRDCPSLAIFATAEGAPLSLSDHPSLLRSS